MCRCFEVSVILVKAPLLSLTHSLVTTLPLSTLYLGPKLLVFSLYFTLPSLPSPSSMGYTWAREQEGKCRGQSETGNRVCTVFMQLKAGERHCPRDCVHFWRSHNNSCSVDIITPTAQRDTVRRWRNIPKVIYGPTGGDHLIHGSSGWRPLVHRVRRCRGSVSPWSPWREFPGIKGFLRLRFL